MANNLRALRDAAGLTLTALSGNTGISAARLVALEAGAPFRSPAESDAVLAALTPTPEAEAAEAARDLALEAEMVAAQGLDGLTRLNAATLTDPTRMLLIGSYGATDSVEELRHPDPARLVRLARSLLSQAHDLLTDAIGTAAYDNALHMAAEDALAELPDPDADEGEG